MRFESALKVVRLLKTAIGQPLSIRAICQAIDLSYQPTYKHVRSLEREGVIRTDKQGREVRCELTACAATSLWLGLVSVAERRELLAQGGALAEVAASAAECAHQTHAGADLVIALRPARASQEPKSTLLAIVPEDGNHLVRDLRRCCTPDIRLESLTQEAFCERMQRPFERNPLLAESVVLAGEQQFWTLAFAAETPAPEPAPAQPMVRSRRQHAPTPPTAPRPRPRPRQAPASPTRPASDDDVLFVD